MSFSIPYKSEENNVITPRMKWVQWLLVAVLCTPAMVRANALQLTDISVDQAAQTVSCNIEWQNSWRVDVVPFNWDAVWVFVKFRPCGVDPNTPWTHGILNLGGSTVPAELEATQRDGTPGMDADNLGMMLRQSASGVYPVVGPHALTLNVTNMPVDDVNDPIDIKVVGIEMVFIPEGQFTIGDGGTSYRQFVNTLIDEEETTYDLSHPTWTSGSLSVTAPEDFPKGYAAFYIMKYEITQGQYAAFLNTLNANATISRYLNRYEDYRNRIGPNGTTPELYVADRPDRACNYLSWADITAYLDWACLRPMSELEFEKACRGPLAPTANEYAWGSTSISCGTELSTTVPSEDGSEVFMPLGERNARCANTQLTGGYGPSTHNTHGRRGPIRSGIFALPTSENREATGATYYGVMEMTGNVNEWVVFLTPQPESQDFEAVTGDGVLTTDGAHNVPEWPSSDIALPNNTTTGNQDKVIGVKGGSFENGTGTTSVHRVSDRYYTRYRIVANGNSRSRTVGGRGVR